MRINIRIIAILVLWTCAGLGCSGPSPVSNAAVYNPPERIQVSRPTFEGHTQRPLRYHPEGTDFVIENGQESFNRPLYGGNTAFRVDGGDRPEFSLYLPGLGGNLRLGMRTATKTIWLFEADKVISRYRAGSMVYEIYDASLGNGVLEVTVTATYAIEGLVGSIELHGQPKQPVEIVIAFGGANGKKGKRNGDIGCESEPVSEFFRLRPEYCKGNRFSIQDNTFILQSKPATLSGVLPRGAKLSICDAAKWGSLKDLLTTEDKTTNTPILAGYAVLSAEQPVYFGLKRLGENDKPLKTEMLPALFGETEKTRQSLAEQVKVETPDMYINAAVSALCTAADAIWDEPQGVVMHGAVAWRTKLPGWRGPYANDALGRHDRAKRHLNYWASEQNTSPPPAAILPADASANLSRNEASLHSNGDIANKHYDMNLVYIDALFRHILWTGDLELARQVWPVIERHLAWERRLFRRPFGPDKLPLYEAYCCIWASDDLAYNGGGATHSSAYNYYHNRMAARLAKLLGKDPSPYDKEAELILKAMRTYLWLADSGSYAEWRDLLGLQLPHPAAALWTVYHTMDSEVPTPLEAWQMTHYVDTQIAHIPIHGPGVPQGDYFTLPTSNWMPYTWSTNNVVMAEAAHTALAYWQAGRPHEAFGLFKGCLLDSMFLGLCPGNLGMTTYFDSARGEAQRDFADAVGVCSRAVVEGLFGVRPDVPAGQLLICPGFPADWQYARLKHPDVNIEYERKAAAETYNIEPKFAKPLSLCLNIPAFRTEIESVAVNGQPAKWNIVDTAIGRPRIEIRCDAQPRYKIVIAWKGEVSAQAEGPVVAAQGGRFEVHSGAAKICEVSDPQKALERIKLQTNSFEAIASGTPGHHTAFAQVEQGALRWRQPIVFEIRPAYEILPCEKQDADKICFRIRNNTSDAIRRPISVTAGSITSRIALDIPAYGTSEEVTLLAKENHLLPGTNAVLADFGEGKKIEGAVINWKLDAKHAAIHWEKVDLVSVFNDRLTRIFQNEYLSPRSPYCSLAIPKQGIGSWCNYAKTFDVDDAGLRKAADANGGQVVLPQGIPFQTSGSGEAKNILFTSQWDNYPAEATVRLGGKASHLYLLTAGSTNSMQSQFDNGEVIITYADGTTQRLALRNPTTWWPIDQDYFIDDFGFRRPEALPPRVNLKSGLVRVPDFSEFKGQGGGVPGGAATVLDMPLNPEKELKSLTVRTLANEVIIGLMSITLVR
jgi:hypothetical protein